MFFIVSTGRSGTTTIAKTLNEIEGCYAVHEPAPELILESSEYHYGKMEKEKLKDILVESRKPMVDGSVYCESNQCLSLLIPVLKETFPEGRYIWLIRNGMDVVASTMQKQWYTGHSENFERYEDCSDIKKAWIDGRIRGDLCGEMSSEEWNGMSRFAKCCWYWSYVNQVIENDLNKYAKEEYQTIYLEKIEMELTGVVRWMGFDVESIPEIKLENVARRVPFHWTEWELEEWETFKHWCGKLMDKYYPSWRTFTTELAEREENKHFLLSYINTLKHQVHDYTEKHNRSLEVIKTKNEQIKKLGEQIRNQDKKIKSKDEQIMSQNEQIRNNNEQINKQNVQINALFIAKGKLNEKLYRFKNSFSWRITKPIRLLVGLIKKVF